MSPAVRRVSRTTFAALAVPNYRLYLAGQATSLVGTWMQMAAQSWLVYTLTHSATDLGLIVALQTLPVLVLGPYGGVVADRVDKRRAMIGLQAMMALQALTLGLLTVTHSVHLWEIGALAFVLGLNNTFENPARQSFMLELVGPDHLRNAVSLNSTMVNVARVIGPGIGGIMIAVVGSGWCFLINAVSFIAVINSLTRMDTSKLSPVPPSPRAGGQLREGLRYVRRERKLALPLAMAAVVGCLAYEFQVSLPYMAAHGLHVGSAGYGFMTAAMGVGAAAGGLWIAARGRIGSSALIIAALGYGVAMTLSAAAPDLVLELLALALVGASSVAFMSMTNATLQLRAAPEMRGRVMALWFVSFQGSTPIGGPIVGAVMAGYGARAGLGIGAIACFVVAAAGAFTLRSLRARSVDASVSADASAPTDVLAV
ncbi:MAG TPA: MFS transporter [Solirubrobacteraceae bacterium]|nr:MFS transporter [Solirubrobacteraceae bacterium]